MNEYNGWKLLKKMPDGWKIDLTAGSPLYGYVFITDGKSVLNGQKRALLKIEKKELKEELKPISKIEAEPEKKQNIDSNYLKTVNQLARKKFEEKMLKDIMVDLMVCEIEKWDKREYLRELKNLIEDITKNLDKGGK